MKFSVITINYNNYHGLRSTIESVAQQTCTDLEYIVIDGGSTDGSVEVIKEFSDAISYWISEKDRGIYHAMNKGVAQAHGDYCLFMNSGDVFHHEAVLERIAKFDMSDDVVVGKVSINDQDDIISPPPPDGQLTLYHLFSGSIPHQGAFIKTNLLRKYPYDETLSISSDWKFFVQILILDNCSIRYVDEFVARYELNGISANNPKLMRQEKEEALAEMFPMRVLADYKRMKASECLTQTLTTQLRKHYTVDRILYNLGRMLLKWIEK